MRSIVLGTGAKKQDKRSNGGDMIKISGFYSCISATRDVQGAVGL